MKQRTFLATPALDDIPPEAPMFAGVPKAWATTLSRITVSDSHGKTGLGCGLSLVLP